MKNIILTILTGVVTSIALAQNPNNQPFIGTWEYQNGNEIFRIEIWENDAENGLRGHYWLIEVDNYGNEIIVDKSEKVMIEGSDRIWTEAFGLGTPDGIKATGLIRDVTPLPKDVTWIDGLLQMTILPVALNEPMQAEWIVSYDGFIFYDARFQIPTNCILTKVD